MAQNQANTALNHSERAIQLSPPRVPPPASKRQRKKGKNTDEYAKNVLFENLFKDPVKKRMVMQLLECNKELFDQYGRKESSMASPVNKVKKIPSFESPTALMKRRLMEKQRRQNNAEPDALIESRLKSIAVSSSRKIPKSALLQQVHAFVEVFAANDVDQSKGVKELMQKLGATIASSLTIDCTHVIYRYGTYETFKKAKELKLPLVSILWLDVIDRTGRYIPPEWYPALSDLTDSIKSSDELCERLNGKRRSSSVSAIINSENISKPLLSTCTYEFDDDHIMNMQEKNHQGSLDEIAGSEPDRNTVMFDKTKFMINKDDNSDSNSDAASTEPLIAGHVSRKTRAELDASYKLSETLLNSPFIAKTRKALCNSDDLQSMSNSEGKTNRPGANKRSTKVSCKSNLFKENTKQKENMNEAETPIPNTKPAQRRRTLLHPESLGIVDDTDNYTLPMEITLMKNATLKALNAIAKEEKKNDTPTSARRKTNCNMVSMDITDFDCLASNTITVEKENVPTPKENRMSNATENEKTAIKTVVDRTSLSSTNTTRSDDLSSYRRVTRRMSTFLAKSSTPEALAKTPVSKRNNSVNKESNSCSLKFSLRVSDATEKRYTKVHTVEEQNTDGKTTNTEETVLLGKGCEEEVVGEQNRVSAASSTRTSASDDLLIYYTDKTTRRITRRMSTHVNKHTENNLVGSEPRNSLDTSNKTKYSSGTDISLKVTEISSSDVPSLRLSSQNLLPSIGQGQIQIENIQVSPVSEISNKLLHTTLSIKTNAVKTTPVSTTSTSMLSTSIDTASTSYSIVDDSTEPSHDNQSSRSRSGCPSLISNLGTTRTTTTSKNVSKASSQKRRLCNPDEALDDTRNDGDKEEEERRAATKATLAKMDADATRTVLQKRLDLLKIPNPLPELEEEEEDEDEDGNDSEFEIHPPLSRGTQPSQQTQQTQTQSQSKRMKFIVCTRFHAGDIAKFKEIVEELGEFTIEDKVTKRTTHLVVLEASRTLNLLKALSRGIWILRGDWIFDSKEAGKWLDEDAYELTEFSRLVQELRLQRESFGKRFCHDVFVDCGEIFMAPSCHPKAKDLAELVILCKGEVTTDLDNARIIIGRLDENESQSLTESQVNMVESWILDCITFGRIKKYKHYLIT